MTDKTAQADQARETVTDFDGAAALASVLAPAPLVATTCARAMKQLLEDGERERAWDLLCRSWETVYLTVLKPLALKQAPGPLAPSILVLREYFNHRGNWDEVVECEGLEQMLHQTMRHLHPDALERVMDSAVERTVASAKAGLFAP